jgi:hypothetical protein
LSSAQDLLLWDAWDEPLPRVPPSFQFEQVSRDYDHNGPSFVRV